MFLNVINVFFHKPALETGEPPNGTNRRFQWFPVPPALPLEIDPAYALNAADIAANGILLQAED